MATNIQVRDSRAKLVIMLFCSYGDSEIIVAAFDTNVLRLTHTSHIISHLWLCKLTLP